MFDPTILRAYDIRGTFGKTLSRDVAVTLGRQFGSWLQTKDKSSLALCCDGRLSSPILKAGLIEGLISRGVEVIDIGVGPTPMLYFSVHHMNLDAGIMITGSHNPPEDNGFKITLKDRPFFGDDILELNNPALIGTEEQGGVSEICVMAAYIQRLLEGINFHDMVLRIGIDCGNGATGEVMTRLAKKFPPHVHVQLLYPEIDGTFPNHHPDPADPKNLTDLIARVKKERLDLGIAFDGDGDRLGVVDRKGNAIAGDQLTLFFAMAILRENPEATIMADVKSSQLLFEAVEAAGGVPVMTPTGHSNFKALMPKNGALFGGEMSGHFFFKDRYFGYDDGLYAMMRMIELTALGYDVGQFLSLIPHFYASPEIKIPCADDKKFGIIEDLKSQLVDAGETFIDIDGVRFSLDGGWWLLRASNTSPYLIVRIESYTEHGYGAIKEHLANLLETLMPDVSIP